MKQVAIEHVQSGVAWIRADGMVGSINQSFADTLGAVPRELVARDWHDLFIAADQERLKEAYSKMLLVGKATLDVQGRRMDGKQVSLELLMVAIHNHKMRFVGHHCLVVDRTRERMLEAQVAELSSKARSKSSAAR